MSQTRTETVRGRAVVMQPEDGPSYWQPVPANGHADPKLYPARTGFAGHAMGARWGDSQRKRADLTDSRRVRL